MQGQLSSTWGNLLKTAASLRTGIPQAHLDFSHSPPDEVEAMLRRINGRAVATAHDLIEHYDFSAVRTLVDVGGGGGGLALILTEMCPHLQATVVDLPQVMPITQKIVDEEGGTGRVTVLAANAVRTPIPGAYDVAVLQRVIQVLSAEDARQVIRHAGAAVNPGGTIYIIGQILDDSRTSPPSAVDANLNWINLYDEGESYTEHQHRVWLSEAGFADIERADFFIGAGLGVITARKRG
jgi:cyclopropane fatty-acyl-phospholipid synthase-like methyltransferase